MHFSKNLPKQHVHVQYHFTFGVTDRLSDLMQFSKLRVNQSYGLLPSIRAQSSKRIMIQNITKTSAKVKPGMQYIRMSRNLFTLQPNKAKKLSMLPITLCVPIKTLLIINSNQVSSLPKTNNVILKDQAYRRQESAI